MLQSGNIPLERCSLSLLPIQVGQLSVTDKRDKPDPVAQSVAGPTADPGIMRSISARSHTFDVHSPPSPDSRTVCLLQAKLCA